MEYVVWAIILESNDYTSQWRRKVPKSGAGGGGGGHTYT